MNALLVGFSLAGPMLLRAEGCRGLLLLLLLLLVLGGLGRMATTSFLLVCAKTLVGQVLLPWSTELGCVGGVAVVVPGCVELVRDPCNGGCGAGKSEGVELVCASDGKGRRRAVSKRVLVEVCFCDDMAGDDAGLLLEGKGLLGNGFSVRRRLASGGGRSDGS